MVNYLKVAIIILKSNRIFIDFQVVTSLFVAWVFPPLFEYPIVNQDAKKRRTVNKLFALFLPRFLFTILSFACFDQAWCLECDINLHKILDILLKGNDYDLKAY